MEVVLEHSLSNLICFCLKNRSTFYILLKILFYDYTNIFSHLIYFNAMDQWVYSLKLYTVAISFEYFGLLLSYTQLTYRKRYINRYSFTCIVTFSMILSMYKITKALKLSRLFTIVMYVILVSNSAFEKKKFNNYFC